MIWLHKHFKYTLCIIGPNFKKICPIPSQSLNKGPLFPFFFCFLVFLAHKLSWTQKYIAPVYLLIYEFFKLLRTPKQCLFSYFIESLQTELMNKAIQKRHLIKKIKVPGAYMRPYFLELQMQKFSISGYRRRRFYARL